MTRFDAFILIGGRSSRLGSDKALADLDGKSLVERAVDTVRGGLDVRRVTAVAANAAQFAIPAIAENVPFIFDLYEARGPLGGLHAALAHAETSWILVLACDYPFVLPELITLLSEHVAEGFGAVLPEQEDGRAQPLCAFYNVAIARPVVEEIIARPGMPPPMHEVAKALQPRIVKFNEYSHLPGAEYMFANINTAADLERAQEIQRKLSGPK
jgi:molybdenum cofactor guanylyltransferase